MHIIKSIPSPNGKNTLYLYVDNAQLLVERGDLDYFNDRSGSGRIVSNNNSSSSKFYLATPNEQVFFDNFECLYNYGAYSWWDNKSRYFFLTVNTHLVFIFDCHTNKWASISTLFEIISAYITNDEVQIDGFKNSFSTTETSSEPLLATHQLSNLIWKNDGINIKAWEKKKAPIQKLIISDSPVKDVKKYAGVLNNFKQNLSKGVKALISIAIVSSLASLLVYFHHISFVVIIPLAVGMILLLFMLGDKGYGTDKEFNKVYQAWLVKKFGLWLPLSTLMVTFILSSISNNYRISLFNSLVIAFSFIYLGFVIFSEIPDMILLRDDPTLKQHCKSMYKKEREKGKSLMRFFLEININKLSWFLIPSGSIALITYGISSLFSP